MSARVVDDVSWNPSDAARLVKVGRGGKVPPGILTLIVDTVKVVGTNDTVLNDVVVNVLFFSRDDIDKLLSVDGALVATIVLDDRERLESRELISVSRGEVRVVAAEAAITELVARDVIDCVL